MCIMKVSLVHVAKILVYGQGVHVHVQCTSYELNNSTFIN